MAWSTMECETDAAASGLQEALRLKTIIEELEGAKFEIRMRVFRVLQVMLDLYHNSKDQS